MSEQFSYQDYVNDDAFLESYNDYQSRYSERVRESDKVIINLVKKVISEHPNNNPTILDIGCSTGNLLLHLNNLVPKANYVGGDLAESSLEVCRNNSALKDIQFEQLDITNLPRNQYDIVIVNAVFYMLDHMQYEQALKSIGNALNSGGSMIVYDFAHPFEHQNLVINETSLMHPNGLRLCFRPMKFIEEKMLMAGFEKPCFNPFEIPITLPKPEFDQEVVTYTTESDEGRLMFRGTLYQPWCHIVARKA
ncbi:MAG: class I SAM-dependent methyltransferase [Leptolyngbyaceae cyanobacterium]|mgnify:CR=1 FL=1